MSKRHPKLGNSDRTDEEETLIISNDAESQRGKNDPTQSAIIRDLTRDIDDDEVTRRSRVVQKFDQFLDLSNLSSVQSTGNITFLHDFDSPQVSGLYFSQNSEAEEIIVSDSERLRQGEIIDDDENSDGDGELKSSYLPKIEFDIDSVNRAIEEEKRAAKNQENEKQVNPFNKSEEIPLQALSELLDSDEDPRDLFQQDLGLDEEELSLDAYADEHQLPYGHLYHRSEALTEKNYAERVQLPFEIEITDEDRKHGLQLSTLSKEVKDATFPIPSKPHVPGVISRRYFGPPPPVTTTSTPSRALFWLITIVLLALLIYAAVSYLRP